MYSVSRDGTWTNDGKATKTYFESKGCTVKPSRLTGDFDVFIDGARVASIFNKKADQIAHLKDKGLI